jgi:hypothetical protein
MAKETDLLNDPLASAQLRYREQIDAFKDQFIPKPKRNPINELLIQNNMRPNAVFRRK